MPKISITGLEARNKAIKGMSYVAEAVKSTIGPFGLNFLLEKGNKVTNDGAKIGAELCGTIKNEYERRGALVAHEASSKTNEMVGDATSSAWALTDAIVKEAVRFLPNEKSIKAKHTPSEIIQMIKKSKDAVLSEMEKVVTPITTKEELILSALVSVEDKDIAEILGSMQWELGPEGVIVAEEVNEVETTIEKVTGIRLDNGFSHSHVITNPSTQSLEIDNVNVLMTNYTIGEPELLGLKSAIFDPLIAQKKYGIVLIARAFTPDAIKICEQSTKAGFAIFPLNAPYINQTEIMHDIEAVVGGRYIDTEEASLSDIYLSDIGFAKRFTARYMDALVTGEDNEQSKPRVLKRVEELKKKLEGEKSVFYKKMIESRIAQLTNGFGILKVGSQSITNRKRLFDKCEDAVSAVRYALKGGTVKGAGQAFKDISDALPEGDILKRPILCIYNQIISSAPEDFEIPSWVRDPFLVLKVALENACDFAGTFATVNGIITSENPPTCKCSNNIDVTEDIE